MDDSEKAPNPGALQKARSLPRLNVEETAEVNSGRRYLTPQPKRKPFIPPRPPADSFRRSLSSFSPQENGIPVIEVHEELSVETESYNNPSNAINVMKTEHTHENERLEEAKCDLVATSGPLTPKRKAPQPPPSNRGGRRRKSDTNAADLRQIRKQQKSRVKSLGPNQGLGTSDSDLSSSPDGSPVKKRLFYTPQPRRKQFNLDRDTSLDSYDVAHGSTRSPVERAAKLAMSKRAWGSSDSSDSTPSPVPQSVSPEWLSPRSPPSLSSQHSTTSSSTPPTASPKKLPISPLASPLKVNTQKSSLSGITWQSTVNTVDETRPQRKISRSRPSSTPSLGSVRQKPFRKATSDGSSIGIQSNTRSSAIRKGKQRMHRSKSASKMSLPRSPDRSVDPVQAFGAAIQAEHAHRQDEPQTPGSSNDPSSPSSCYISSPSPTSSPRHRPSLMRHIRSVSSTRSMKSIFGSTEVLNDLFLSERGANKRLKAVAGIITGLVLGVILMIGLHYGLKYGHIAAFVITAVSTLFMSLCLAFTVRGRCVALLMVPTLCTQRGRAAFLAIVVALLLNGPIKNIFLNANVVSNSMSCSAELAYNQSQQIKEVAAEVFDEYLRNLAGTVTNLQDVADGLQGVFDPIENGLGSVQKELNMQFLHVNHSAS
ncbi:uncharacterized protein [Amphiura filiformis]|uniref:uncharacterized protein n=1 Tax=Amphiura filiformis TaxID=82378 RepID=UPI003B226601